MNFAFTEDQLLLRDAVRAVLAGECDAAVVRRAWEGEPDDKLWRALGDNGVLGLLAAEADGGMGMSELDFSPIAEELGYFGVPGPLVETAAMAVPALAGSALAGLIPALASGEKIATAVSALTPLAPHAEQADVLLVERDGRLWATEVFTSQPRDSVDHTRRLGEVAFDLADAVELGDASDVLRRGTVAVSAQLVGLSRRMLDFAVEYAKVRTQFGKAIGTFQAVQHRLADALLAIEFARPVVSRAAWSGAEGAPDAGMHAAMAKVFASEAATKVAKASLQVHGAIGYSTEYDLHLFMKRAWALAHTYGDARHHRRALAASYLDGATP